MTASDEEYELKGPDANAKGVFTDDGFLVKAGSLARREIAPSGKSVTSVHQRLITDGILEEHGGQLRFTQDQLFNSPSGAAAAVLGRTANGWISWKRADGQTLSEVKRVTRDGHTPMLTDAKRQEIVTRHQQLVNDGKLATEQQLDKQYALFREHFGPSILAGLDGEALLTLMHDHGNKDSLFSGSNSKTTMNSTLAVSVVSLEVAHSNSVSSAVKRLATGRLEAQKGTSRRTSRRKRQSSLPAIIVTNFSKASNCWTSFPATPSMMTTLNFKIRWTK